MRTYIQFNKTKLINLLKKSYNKVLLKFVIGNNEKSMKVVFYNKFTLKKMFEINYELKRYIGQPITILVNGELLHNVLKTIRDNYVQMRIINNKKPYILNDWNGMNELKNYYVLTPSIVDLDELED
jgi:DNA polymerase III sliding clamp (beta) subunit (PCNA family)